MSLSTCTDKETEFRADMNRSISCVIDEAISLFGMDPREYHPFYLRIYKYITVGQKMGYFKSSKDVDSCWEQFDRICDGMMKNSNPRATFAGVESPYAMFIQTGKVVLNGKEITLKRNEEAIRKKFVELEKAAKDILERRRSRKGRGKRKGSPTGNDIRDDLRARLEFFDHCKSMTYPADCVKMNKLWQRFLHEFSEPSKKVIIDNEREEDDNQSIADVSDVEPSESEEELDIHPDPEILVAPVASQKIGNEGNRDLQKNIARQANNGKIILENPERKLGSRVSCGECEQTFVSNLTLRRHMKRRHDPNRVSKRAVKPLEPRSFCCDLCGKSYQKSSTLNRHIRQIHGSNDKPFLCQDCPKQYKSKDWLELHRRQVHLGQDYRCDICSREMQSGGKLWKHKVDIHGMSDLEPPVGVNVTQCDVCGERLLRGMLQHLEKNHPEHAGSFQVEAKKEDRAAFKKEQWRKMREEGVGPTWLKLGKKIPPKTCSHCDQIFDREGLWRDHVKEAHQNMKYRCPKPNCGESFKFYRSFQSHLRKSHGQALIRLMKILKGLQFIEEVPNKQWRCIVCKQILECEDDLHTHFTLKHQETLKKIGESNEQGTHDNPSLATTQLLKCPYCEEEHSTNQTQTLREHVKDNHSEVCWNCPEPECEWVVISPADLQEHSLLEHTDRPEPISEFLKKFNHDEGSKQNRQKLPTPKTTHKRKPRKTAGRQVKGSETDADSEAQTSNATSDDEDYIEDKQMTSKSTSPLRPPTRRRVGKRRSRSKTESPTKLHEFQLKPCQVSVHRLGQGEIESWRSKI